MTQHQQLLSGVSDGVIQTNGQILKPYFDEARRTGKALALPPEAANALMSALAKIPSAPRQNRLICLDEMHRVTSGRTPWFPALD